MLEITVTRNSNLSAETVYVLLADFGNTSWMKGVTKTDVEGDGVGMVRAIFAGPPENPPVREMLTERDDLKRKVAYSIPENNPMPVDEYAAYAIVTEVGTGCQIEWTGNFVAKEGIDDETAKNTVGGMYGVLIEWLLEGAAKA
jgi:hypothetical protein